MNNFRDIRCSVSALEYGSGLSFNDLQCAKVIRKIFVNILVGTAASVGSNFNTMRLETPISLYYYICLTVHKRLAKAGKRRASTFSGTEFADCRFDNMSILRDV